MNACHTSGFTQFQGSVRLTTPHPLLYRSTDFTLVGRTGRPQFLDFYTPNCPLCERNRSVIERLENNYRDAVDFIYIEMNQPETLPLQQKYQVMGIAQYVLVDKNGDLLRNWFGLLNSYDIRDALFDSIEGLY